MFSKSVYNAYKNVGKRYKYGDFTVLGDIVKYFINTFCKHSVYNMS